MPYFQMKFFTKKYSRKIKWQPEKPVVEHTDKEAPGQGKGSLWGSPYSGRPIDFDDVKIVPEGD